MNQKILLVDDEPAALNCYRQMLASEFDIATAASGGEGLVLLRNRGPFAVVISDMQMAGMDGVQFLKRVRLGAPNTIRLLLTGSLDLNGIVDAVNEDFNPNPSNGYSHNGLLKLDHSFNEDNRVSFRVFLGQGTQTAPNSTHLSPYGEVVPSHMQTTFVDADTNFNPIALGLNTGVTSPVLAGAPNIVIFGFDQVGVNPFSGRTDVTGHLTDTLSYVTGKHQLRFGGEFRRTQVDVYYNFGARGVFDFTGGQGPWASLANDPNQDTNVLSLADFMAATSISPRTQSAIPSAWFMSTVSISSDKTPIKPRVS